DISAVPMRGWRQLMLAGHEPRMTVQCREREASHVEHVFQVEITERGARITTKEARVIQRVRGLSQQYQLVRKMRFIIEAWTVALILQLFRTHAKDGRALVTTRAPMQIWVMLKPPRGIFIGNQLRGAARVC